MANHLARGCIGAIAGLLASFAPAQAETAVNGNLIERFFQAYADEWNPPAADPNAPTPVIRRPAPFPPQPQTQPPMPFVEWPFGGGSPIGASVPNAVVSPLMQALAPTTVGKALNDANIQVYGWVNPGLNLSTNGQRGRVGKNANFPAAYSYWANTVQMDQTALFVERIPDTVQKDHVDWGFRVAGIYGMNYRYTTALGFASYQLQKHNNQNGWDFPMVYGEVYFPAPFEGLLIRVGRFISVPDIEAQLAPNNYMYSHSMTYAFDNYTNTGMNATLMVTNNWQVQFGIATGTDTMPWNSPATKDRGVQPSYTACVRWTSDSARTNSYTCANAINNGMWGYNNLQQYTTTFYHSFSPKWHISAEFWHMHQNGVPNANVTGGDYSGTQFSGFRNAPFQAQCNTSAPKCAGNEWSVLAYLNYRVGDHDNISFRGEFFNDQNGQRTGYQTRYANAAVGWQHWIGTSITLRPEVAYYNAIDRKAFDNGQRRQAVIASADLIWHF
jgi:hypothetical protein